jgi:hypothetical protein
MLETYQGILRNSHIEWSGEAPAQLPSNQGVRVHVTLQERLPPLPRRRRKVSAWPPRWSG